MRTRTRWEHLSEVPDPIRVSMGEIFSPWVQRDLHIENTLGLILDDSHTREQVYRVLESSSNRGRIPALCRQLSNRHPEISRRQIFRAVALFLGLHEKSVQRAFYTREAS